jgi:hypothetical protein
VPMTKRSGLHSRTWLQLGSINIEFRARYFMRPDF